MIVLDCSAAVEMVRETDQGLGFKELMLAGEEVVAPDLYASELNNSIFKYVRRGEVAADEAQEMGRIALGYVDTYVDCKTMWSEALSEAVKCQHPSYDIFYLVLARRNTATLFTADRKLQRICMESGVDCVYLDTEF